jgi:predicted TIM-barrel enzyme
MTPDKIAAGLWGIVRAGRPVVMAGVGSGLTAAGAARGGAHLIAAYSTAVYRCRGMPSVLSFLPYDDANALAVAVVGDVVAQAQERPVILGVGAHDPRKPLESILNSVEVSSAERSPVIQSVAQSVGDFARPLRDKPSGVDS